MKMAGEKEEEGFWLPSEILTDDDFLMENNTESESEFRFPTEFPYDSGTRSDKLLEKSWMMASSRAPQSCNGSSNGFLPTPKYDAVGDLIYLAAGEVAKLRLSRDYADKGLSASPRSHPQFYSEAKIPNPSVYLNSHFHQKQENEGCGMLYNRQPLSQNRSEMGQAAWTLPQNPTRGRPVIYGGSGGSGGAGGGRAPVKRKCAGTGVFLPRRYENMSNNTHFADSQRKTGQVYTKNFANVNGFTQAESRPQLGINRSFVPDYHLLMARRNALVLQQRRSLLASLAEGRAMLGRDLYLPQGDSGLW